MEPERIDYSRYRVSASIAELHRAGEGIPSIAETYNIPRYFVELIIAAYDCKDEYAGLEAQ